MPTHEEIQALIVAAKERAATEVIPFIPEKQGDNIAGVVVELGTITTIYGDYYTTTIRVMGTVTGLFDDGRKENTLEFADKLVRVAWMGAVLQSTYLRMRPAPDDFVAFHYQKDVPPQNGKNDYALIVAVVLDGETLKAKIPVDLSVPEVTEEQVSGADGVNEELPPNQTDTIRKVQRKSPLEPVAGETPL